MSILRDEIARAREQAKIYTLSKIDQNIQSESCLFVFTSEDGKPALYFNNCCAFGDWLIRLEFKIGDKLKIKTDACGLAKYAEAVEEKK